MKYTVLPIFIALLLTLAGCGGRQADTPETQPEEPAPVEEPKEPKYLPETSPSHEESAEETDPAELTEEQRAQREESRAREKLAGMTLEQKVGQLFFVRCPAAGAADKVAQYHLGGVLLFTSDYKDAAGNWLTAEQLVTKLRSFQTAALYDTRIPLFIGSDEEGGTVTRASRNPNLFPQKSRSPQELYAEGGIGAVLNDAAQKSYLLRSYGVNVNFAPVCDVSTDPDDFIYARSFGQDAATTAAYVERVVSAMSTSGMACVLKHFPGYGNNADTHTGVAFDERPAETFQTSDLVPFAAGIRAGAPFVLVSHNIVACMDPELPASLSPAVHRLLRETMEFDGVILTDDLAMEAVGAYAADGSAAVLALRAGNDMLVTGDFETQIPQVIAAVKDGTLAESVIDEAVFRVLRAKLHLGLLEG